MASIYILIFHFVRKIQIVQEISLKGITDIMKRKFVSQVGRFNVVYCFMNLLGFYTYNMIQIYEQKIQNDVHHQK